MSPSRPLAVLLGLVFSTANAAEPAQADLLIRHARVVDVAHARILDNQAVAVRGQDIVASGPDAAVAATWHAQRSSDAAGRYLLPGLWDMHVHFGGGPELIEENKALLPLYIANGITTIRDCSGDLPEQVLSWRADIAAGRLFGPQLFSSGAKLEGIKPVWKGTIEVGTRADVDAALDRLQNRDKVDFVKITDSTLQPELFLYAVSEAKKRHMRTSGHIPMALTVHQAVEAGISSIEHIDYAFNAGVRDGDKIAADFGAGRITRAEASARLYKGFDPEVAMASYRELAQRGVFVTPTLNGSRILANLDNENHDKDAGLAYVGPGLRKTYEWRVERAAKATPEQIAARHAHFEQVAAVLPMLQKAGVTIMAGTDAGFLNSYNYPAFALHDELALFVKLGLTPAQALASATRAGPAWFGKLDRYGAVEKGKAADLLLVDHNPLENIGALREIHAVVLRGQLEDRAALDAMLEQTRAKVAAWNAAAAQKP